MSATANVTSGAPPAAASRSSGDVSWLNASLPHGNPPNGARSRSASCAVHTAATAGTHAHAAVRAQPARAAAG